MFKQVQIYIGAVNINIYEFVSPPLLTILQHSGHLKIVLQCLNKCKHYICAVNLDTSLCHLHGEQFYNIHKKALFLLIRRFAYFIRKKEHS